MNHFNLRYFRYIYGGRISLEKHDTSDIIKILVAASQLDLQDLIPHIQSFLIKNKANWMEQNFDFIHQTSFENDSFLELQEYCTDLISKEPDKIFQSQSFSLISENLLTTLVKNDNAQMSVIQVWEHVLKWGLARNPELSHDIASFSKEDFNTLRNSLQRCIPFIKFYNLTSEEFSDRVFPFRKILPKELYMDLLKYFLKSRKIDPKNFDSKVITFEHAELILKWVDKLRITDRLKNSYEFKLMFRGSRDQFSSEKFHQICDNISHTVTIIKVKGSDEILGGYNPVTWKPNI